MSYDFPSWDCLEEQILSELRSKKLKTEKVEQPLINMWIEYIERNARLPKKTRKTIDQVIASKYGSPPHRFMVIDLMADLLLEKENKDKNRAPDSEERWISKFAKMYIDLFDSARKEGDDGALKLLRNTVFISLNYERCFAHHFFPSIRNHIHTTFFEDRDFHKNRAKELISFFRVYQPHGSFGGLSIGLLSGNPIHVVESNTPTNQTNYKTSGQSGSSYGHTSFGQPIIDVVGETDLNLNYDGINKNVVPGTNNCVALGLSSLGISGCKLDWSEINNLYYFGNEPYENAETRLVKIKQIDNNIKLDMQMVNAL